MRKTLEAVALILLLAVWGLTTFALFGPDPLPARIPTHFDPAGRPNGWGTPLALWFLPLVATVIYALMTLVARFPSSFNFPLRVTPATRPRLEAISLNLLAWLKTEVAFLFAWIQYQVIRFARMGRGTLSPGFLPIVLLAVFGTIAWHIAAMRRAARAG